MKPTKHTQLTALESGDITALVLAAHPGALADSLTTLAGRGLFRFRTVRDHDYNVDGDDTYNSAANPDIDPAVIKAQRAKELRRINEMGTWGVITEVRPDINGSWQNPDPQEPGSLWGNIGLDFVGSGYDLEQMQSAATFFGLGLSQGDFEDAQQDAAWNPVEEVATAKGRFLAAELLTLRQLADSVGDLDHDSYLLTLGRVEAAAKEQTSAFLKLEQDAALLARLLEASQDDCNKLRAKPAPVLGFDGFGLNNIADEYRSRVFTMSGEYRPGNAKAEEGAAFLAALEATGVVTRNY